MKRIYLLFVLSLFTCLSFGQYDWKLQKNKDGIKVFFSEAPGSDFKSVKVECILEGDYYKLISILSDVAHFSNWIYNSKNNRILKQIAPGDFIYYTESPLPWPMTDRDIIIHLQLKTDKLPRLLTISGMSVPTMIPEVTDKVRVKHYKANWIVTMPAQKTIQIVYILELNPGGDIPAWVSNSFMDKGPYETFSKLKDLLKMK